jgi:hypothetical protein
VTAQDIYAWTQVIVFRKNSILIALDIASPCSDNRRGKHLCLRGRPLIIRSTHQLRNFIFQSRAS